MSSLVMVNSRTLGGGGGREGAVQSLESRLARGWSRGVEDGLPAESTHVSINTRRCTFPGYTTTYITHQQDS